MEKSSISKAIMRLFITLLGIAFIIWGMATVALGFIGERGTAIITDIRREGGERNDGRSGRYTYNIGYTFRLPNGKSVNGYTKRIGNSVYLKADGKTTTSVRYFSFFPYVNSLEKDTEPGFGQLILVSVGGFLIFVMNKRKNCSENKV